MAVSLTTCCVFFYIQTLTNDNDNNSSELVEEWKQKAERDRYFFIWVDRHQTMKVEWLMDDECQMLKNVDVNDIERCQCDLQIGMFTVGSAVP